LRSGVRLSRRIMEWECGCRGRFRAPRPSAPRARLSKLGWLGMVRPVGPGCILYSECTQVHNIYTVCVYIYIANAPRCIIYIQCVYIYIYIGRVYYVAGRRIGYSIARPNHQAQTSLPGARTGVCSLVYQNSNEC
jgi:hypothetical protein